MAVRAEFPLLRQKLGDDGFLDLHGMLDRTRREWKTDVLETASDRFERRLTEEISSVRVEIAAMRVSILRWMFALWASAILAIVLK
jgi:hypothetical protein